MRLAYGGLPWHITPNIFCLVLSQSATEKDEALALVQIHEFHQVFTSPVVCRTSPILTSEQ